MQSIIDAIEQWLKDFLIGAITGNLSSMFSDVNSKVATIATEVGKTPESWNSSVFSIILTLSKNVVVPIAGLVIAAVLTYELISMIIEKNNMHDIPAVLGMVVVGLYNMMDSIFVGQLVGDVQMGAVSVSYPFTLINAGSAAMLGVGSASVLSRAIGKKDENTVKKIMGNLVAMVLLLSVIYTVIGMTFTRQLIYNMKS